VTAGGAQPVCYAYLQSTLACGAWIRRRDLLCQDQATVPSRGGDSGSPVFSSLNTQTTNVSLHGMLWGTGFTTFPASGLIKMTFSRINYIYAELNPYFIYAKLNPCFVNEFLTARP